MCFLIRKIDTVPRNKAGDLRLIAGVSLESVGADLEAQ